MQNGISHDRIGTSRRTFLKTTALTSVAAIMGGACQTSAQSSMKPLGPVPGPDENILLFDGMEMDLGTLSRLSNAKTCYLTSPVAPISENDKTPKLGIAIQPGEIREIASVDGPGAIQHLWMHPTGSWRFLTLRIYWDQEEKPSIETPIGDFFGQGWGTYAAIASPVVTVIPKNGFNCYWVMPFR